MFVPLHYQVSEYDCVPTAFINAMIYLFERNEIPPMVIRHIYLYSLDTVGRNAWFGVKGTSKYAVRLLGNWLDSYKLKHFSVTTEFYQQNDVHLGKGSRILACLEEGGVALCNVLLNVRDEHYLTIFRVEDDWVYCFDSYRRTLLRGMRNRAEVLASGDDRSANLRIHRSWMDREEKKRFCLGPVSMRECLLIWRSV